ncbi:Unknown protein [Striga hermonthica]|uniref:DUF4283 domain-containing protein n=1 Tax=Striga hermonthica TaxID=68872 RepID=A0A9N7QZX4_STRHE|nr:Unknown protein [Striga hermonthica]
MGTPETGKDTEMVSSIAGRPPDKPPDSPLIFKGTKPSFRDITLLSKPLPPPPQKRDLFKENLAKINLIDNDRLKPVLELDPDYYAAVCRPYEDGLVVRLLGKRVSFFYMREGLKRLWKPHGHLELIDLANGFFMVKFTREEDRETALNGGPWMLSGHYVTVHKWTPQFNPFNDVIENTMVWIRFSGLNLAMFDENIMFCLASMVGTPVKVDLNTSTVERGKYARACVQIDLNQPVVGQVGFQGIWYKVEYEGLYLLCPLCGRYGHNRNTCSFVKPVDSAGQSTSLDKGKSIVNDLDMKPPDELHGDWLVEQKRRRRGRPNKNVGNGETSSPDRVAHKVTNMANPNPQTKAKVHPVISNHSKKEGTGGYRKGTKTPQLPLVEVETNHASAKKRRHAVLSKGNSSKQPQEVDSISRGIIHANRFEYLDPTTMGTSGDMVMEVEAIKAGREMEAHTRPPDTNSVDRN